MPQRTGPRTLSARDKLAIAGFLFFAVLIGSVAGYMAYWARQEAVATFTDEGAEESAPVVSVHPVGPDDEPMGAAVDPVGEAALDPGETTDVLPDDGDVPADGPVRPRIAIVIDDWGYDWAAAQWFFEFPERLTVAVLPFLPLSVAQAEQALEAGHEVIVHMPMEPQNSAMDIGPGGVYVSMDEDAIAEAVAAALAAVPGAVGLNNHMGSRATTEPAVMRTVLQVLQEHDKFFVDSFTTAATVGPALARDMAVPYAVNQVFLDHEDDEEYIRGQIQRLANLARDRGAAIGIGHVRPRTYRALLDMLPELQAEGFEFVTVSELLHVPTPVEVSAPVAVTPSVDAAPPVDAPVDETPQDDVEVGGTSTPAAAQDSPMPLADDTLSPPLAEDTPSSPPSDDTPSPTADDTPPAPNDDLSPETPLLTPPHI